MDENKIREIARTVCDNYAQNGLCFIDGDICDNVVCKYYKGAKALLEQGYRKESDTAREILMALLDFVNGWFEGVEYNDFCVEFNRISKDFAEKYGVDLGE